MMLEQLDGELLWEDNEFLSTHLNKYRSVDHRPKCKIKTMSFEKKTLMHFFYNLGLGKDFLERTQKTLAIKKNDKLDFKTLKNFSL